MTNDLLKSDKPQPELFYFLTDRWFRIMEFSLILGTLNYFKDKTGDFYIVGIYGFSWVIFWCWLLEVIDFVVYKLCRKKVSINEYVIRLVALLICVLIYAFITRATIIIVSK